jgi:hypothetical protein
MEEYKDHTAKRSERAMVTRPFSLTTKCKTSKSFDETRVDNTSDNNNTTAALHYL